MIWTSEQAELVTSGKSIGNWSGERLVIDSRLIGPGDIFLALPGQNIDGHKFVKSALEQGAAAAIVTNTPEDVDPNAPLLIVKDVMKAVEAMAKYNRTMSDAKFIGITGSVGKTSTKEMLKLALSAYGFSFASRGNYNNYLGVPIELASFPVESDFCTIEMGMNHAKEISPLSKMTKPDIAIVTAVEPVHLEFFSSVKEIAAAKAEIFAGVKSEGTIILNKDNHQFDVLRSLAKKSSASRIITVGQEGDVRLIDFTDSAKGSKITAEVFGKQYEYTLGAHGKHIALNSLLVLATLAALNLDPADCFDKLKEFKNLKGRGKHIDINNEGKNFTLIDDSYNANPASVKAALKVLGSFPNRKIAILGNMGELGTEEIDFHKELALDLVQNKIDRVITCGHLMKELFDTLPEDKKLIHCETLEELLKKTNNEIADGDVVLVKGSLGTNIFKLVEQFTEKKLDVV